VPLNTLAGSVPLTLPAGSDLEYVPFPVLAHRDFWQARVEIPLILGRLGIPRGARILEVGCGGGNALVPVARHREPRRLVGLDVDHDLLAAARRRLDREAVAAELVPGDVRDMPFPDAAFDVVLDFGTAYHIADPARALSEIARVLAPGGCFVHETPLAQVLAHPFRHSGRLLPWSSAPELLPLRHALLFASRGRV